MASDQQITLLAFLHNRCADVLTAIKDIEDTLPPVGEVAAGMAKAE